MKKIISVMVAILMSLVFTAVSNAQENPVIKNPLLMAWLKLLALGKTANLHAIKIYNKGQAAARCMVSPNA